MVMRTLRCSSVALVLATLAWTAGRVWAIGFVLGETKEELELDYDVAVQDHGTGRVTIVLTLTNEGRLEPLDEVQLAIPGEEKNPNGGHWMDLVVSIKMVAADDGRRIGRVHILKEWAERAEIWLNTHTMDGKPDPLTRLHHVIPIVQYLNDPPSAAPNATTPPATEPKKD